MTIWNFQHWLEHILEQENSTKAFISRRVIISERILKIIIRKTESKTQGCINLLS